MLWGSHRISVLLGREDIADGGLTVSSSLKKRFTFSFLSIEEDFGRGRILIWRVEHHSTQDIEGRRTGGFFLAEKRFTFAFLSIEEDFGKGRILIWRVEHHSTQDIAGRRTGGFFLAEKALHLPFSIHSRRLRKEEESNWEDDGPNQAVRCIWQHSALRWPTQCAASAIARRCVFEDRLASAGALRLSIPALQRSKGVAGRANGYVHLPPKRKLEPCTRTFLTSYLPEALHHPTFPTLCKQQRKGNGQEAGAALPAKRSAPHSPVLHSV